MADDTPRNDEAIDQPLRDHPLTARRLEKLQAIKERGEDPYPARFDPTAHAAELHDRYTELDPGEATEDQFSVAGRLVALRDMGNLRFAVLQDSTGRIQLFVDRKTLGTQIEHFDELDIGDWIGAAGTIMTTKRGELSIRVDSFTLLSKSLRPLPEKWHGLKDLERRSRQRYLDLIVNEDSRGVAAARIETIAGLRDSFETRDFVEVETPVLHTTAGGAIAQPFVTHHEALGLDMYLRIALELHLKMLVVGGMERVFEIGRIFRNEGIDATHSPEFTMLEAYWAYADYFDIMNLVEEVVAEGADNVQGDSIFEYQGKTLDLTPPYRRVPMLDLVAENTGKRLDFSMSLDELREAAVELGVEPHGAWGAGKIVFEVYEQRVQGTVWDPTFVMDHPKEVSPLARTHRDDANVSERFELVVGGMQIANAFSELTDPLEQRARFEEQARARAVGDQETHPVAEDFLRALEYGFPPTGGVGIGVDRLVMLLSDQAHIRDVQLFPHLRPEG